MSDIPLREELQGYLASMPESKLKALKPLMLKLMKPKKTKLNIKPANTKAKLLSGREQAIHNEKMKGWPHNFVKFED